MAEWERKMAIIKNVHAGMRDMDEPVLWFQVAVGEYREALQILLWDEAKEVLKNVYDMRDLEGKPCWVQDNGYIIRFERLWK